MLNRVSLPKVPPMGEIDAEANHEGFAHPSPPFWQLGFYAI